MSSLLISWSWRNMAVYIILAKWHWLTHSVVAVANTPIEKQIEMQWYPNITTVAQIQIQRATGTKWRACYLSHSLFEFIDLIIRIIQLVVMYEIRSAIQTATIVKDKM